MNELRANKPTYYLHPHLVKDLYPIIHETFCDKCHRPGYEHFKQMAFKLKQNLSTIK